MEDVNVYMVVMGAFKTVWAGFGGNRYFVRVAN